MGTDIYLVLQRVPIIVFGYFKTHFLWKVFRGLVYIGSLDPFVVSVAANLNTDDQVILDLKHFLCDFTQMDADSSPLAGRREFDSLVA